MKTLHLIGRRIGKARLRNPEALICAIEYRIEPLPKMQTRPQLNSQHSRKEALLTRKYTHSQNRVPARSAG